MKKLLYFPPYLSTRVFDDDHNSSRAFRSALDFFSLRDRKPALEARFPRYFKVNNEFNHTGGINASDVQVYVVSGINSRYFTLDFEWALNSSLSNPSALQPIFNIISSPSDIQPDGILLSSQAGASAAKLAKGFRKRNLPVILIDNLDRENFYNNQRAASSFISSKIRDFDLILMKDIPLTIERNDNVIPIAPVPVADEIFRRIEGFANGISSHELIAIDFGFIGRKRPGICRDEREAMLDSASRVSANVLIEESSGTRSSKECVKILKGSRYLLSPSGRVWCSFRHSEFAAIGPTLVMNKPTCHTVQGFFYPPKFTIPAYSSGGADRFADYRRVVEHRLRELLTIGEEERISASVEWREQVLSLHTRESRGAFYRRIFSELI